MMVASRYTEIDEVIAYIHRHIDQPFSLSKLASIAAYSPYHFTRIFKERMGVSPSYYVSIIRLQKAKDLLLQTNLSIRDIGFEIGQQSVGTFTTRFTQRVGVAPAQFRNSVCQAEQHLQELQHLHDWRNIPDWRSNEQGTLEGTIHTAAPFDGVILIGLFPKPVPEGLPLHGTLVSSACPYRICGINPGTYYLLATSVSWGMQATEVLLPHSTLRTRTKKPIIVEPFSAVIQHDITLRPPKLDDPPILISLPLLMNRFLSSRVLQYRKS